MEQGEQQLPDLQREVDLQVQSRGPDRGLAVARARPLAALAVLAVQGGRALLDLFRRQPEALIDHLGMLDSAIQQWLHPLVINQELEIVFIFPEIVAQRMISQLPYPSLK